MLPVPPEASAGEIDKRRHARLLYWMGCWTVAEIARHLDLPVPTVGSWKARDRWDETAPISRIEQTIEAKLIALVLKEPKSGADVRDIDLLGRQIERFARVRRYSEPGGHEGDLNPKIAARNDGPKKKPKRNYIGPEQAAQLLAAFQEGLFGYQRAWWLAGTSFSTRMLLKSRQIGATFYFAREAVVDAVETGRNQIFLSASKNQANVFRGYIVEFVRKYTGVELTGDPIVIDRGDGEDPATLYFLGTNSKTAQSYHGNLYFDEFFWTHRFQELDTVASGMAMHAKWRTTYFSTPSSITHEAHPFWTGALYNKHRLKADRVEFDTSWAALRDGALCPDGIWRQIVTIDDAIAGGCDLFDIERLRRRYNPDQYANLLMCEFVDDTLSVFPLSLLTRAFVDQWDWKDFDQIALLADRRPFGARRVWLGYDPASTGDSAALVVIAPPDVAGVGKFRILEKMQFQGLDFTAQAEAIRQVTERYNVEKIDIDATGIGVAVLQLVQSFFPNAQGHQYTPELKTRLVLKAYDVMRTGRLEYDASWNELTQSFMAIRKTLTASGKAMTYEAGRTEETGHADLAWAVMHALDNEPLEAGITGGDDGGSMEIY